jgi:hypothetical protein
VLGRRLVALGQALGKGIRDLSRNEDSLGILAIFVWLFLFTAGMTVNSSAFTQALEETLKRVPRMLSFGERVIELLWAVWLLILILLSKTISNVALLCLLAGLIGAYASRIKARGGAVNRDEVPGRERYAMAIVGSFLIYLLVMSGSYTLLNIGFTTPSLGSEETQDAAEGYKKLATLASIACLIEGFAPFVFPMVRGLFHPKPTGPVCQYRDENQSRDG